MRRTSWVLASVGLVAIAAKNTRKRARRARKAYLEEVSSRARPIQAVGTAIAAFVGSPRTPSRLPSSRNAKSATGFGYPPMVNAGKRTGSTTARGEAGLLLLGVRRPGVRATALV
jgi:hypothetical protein